jgi:hypothetical protein
MSKFWVCVVLSIPCALFWAMVASLVWGWKYFIWVFMALFFLVMAAMDYFIESAWGSIGKVPNEKHIKK